ncbi:class I SAM-dependent methyltransferase [Kaistia adipata]|uniref:class I SAM-dependent methyltransferase n=1 Tax=Kaistia adipata TaxID=166954 RepID=UPI0004199162|nr:class I SAM-dependent methyltransferase [Kaistia adipata]
MAADEALRLHIADASRRSLDERLANRGFRRLWQERNDALAQLLSTRLEKPLSEYRILDFGCGTGSVTHWLDLQGASPDRLTGVDIQRDRIAKARESYPHLAFVEASGERLPFAAGQFDIALAFTVFSSILDPFVAKRVATEMTRVLATDGGMIIWYDMRYPNPSNPNLRAMTRSRIRHLFPTLDAELAPLTLLPPVAERLGPLTDALYPPLAAIPVLRSHYFGLLRARR